MSLKAQSLESHVMPTAGGFHLQPSGSLSFTIGEPIITTFNTNNITLTQGFQQPFQLHIQLKAYIQGYYTSNGMMNSALYNQGEPNAITEADTVQIELHAPVAPYTLVHSTSSVLQTDGTLTASFPEVSMGESYYIVLKHRNSLETWSALPVVMSGQVYDFSSAAGQAFADNQVEVESGVWALYSGDFNQDDAVDAFDYLLLDPDIFYGAGGYVSTDLNGDGSVDAFDYLIFDINVYNGVGAAMP